MIVRPRPGALGLLFVLRGSVVPGILPRIGTVLLISAAVVAWQRLAPAYFQDLTLAPFTPLGLALSIFLGFRNNAAYERWWDGRKQWGQLLAEVHGLVRDSVVLLPDDPVLQCRFAYQAVVFVHALCDQFRGVEDAGLRGWVPAAEWDAIARHCSHPDAILLTLLEARDFMLL